MGDDEIIKRTMPIKRRDVGIAGAAIVLTQVLSGFHSSQSISEQIENFKKEFQEAKLEREQFFVRKTDMGVLSQKLDKVGDQLSELKEQVAGLKAIVKNGSQARLDYESEPVVFASCQDGLDIDYD